jgi:hypothetical protein
MIRPKRPTQLVIINAMFDTKIDQAAGAII